MYNQPTECVVAKKRRTCFSDVTVTDDFRQAENRAFERYMDSAISYRIVGGN